MRRRAAASALPLALVIAAQVHAGRLQVCTFSFHSPHEVEVFRARLAPDDFDVLDLSPRPLIAQDPGGEPAGAAEAGDAGTTQWLPKLCRSDVRCDVVVYSAEFAGRFFGDYGTSIGLREMEEASCEAQCDGLFHYPREVFLLACNTLATKDQDRRTPADYLQVLLGHGFDRASAERVVALRYGPLGPSFREALRRIFMGVPRIYGFASVAPLGDVTAPRLEKYFRTKGDYRRYLEQVARQTTPNKELLRAFEGTGLVQTTGLETSEPAMADRDRICTLYDEHEAVTRRLQIVRELIARKDFPAFIPSIQVFIDRHPPGEMQDEERGIFTEIQQSDAARGQVLALVDELDVSALQLEMANFAVHMEWMTREDFRRLALDGAHRLLGRPLTSEVVDVMCEISKHERLGDHFTSDDVPVPLYRESEGVRLIDCLAPADERVNVRLARALDDPDESVRLWAAYALSRRLPLQDVVLVQLTRYLDDPSANMRARVRWIFEAQGALSDEVRRAVAARDAGFAADARSRRKPWRGGYDDDR